MVQLFDSYASFSAGSMQPVGLGLRHISETSRTPVCAVPYIYRGHENRHSPIDINLDVCKHSRCVSVPQQYIFCP